MCEIMCDIIETATEAEDGGTQCDVKGVVVLLGVWAGVELVIWIGVSEGELLGIAVGTIVGVVRAVAR